jgi:hypothetical protein
MILGKMEGPYVEFCADDDQRNYSSRSLNFRLTDHLFSMRSRFHDDLLLPKLLQRQS